MGIVESAKLYHVSVDGPKARCGIGHFLMDDERDDRSYDERPQSSSGGDFVASIFSVSRTYHHIRLSLEKRGNEPRYLSGIMLSIGVDLDGDLMPHLLGKDIPRLHCPADAQVVGQVDDIGACPLRYDGGGIGRAIVDDYYISKGGAVSYFGNDLADAFFLIIGGDDDQGFVHCPTVLSLRPDHLEVLANHLSRVRVSPPPLVYTETAAGHRDTYDLHLLAEDPMKNPACPSAMVRGGDDDSRSEALGYHEVFGEFRVFFRCGGLFLYKDIFRRHAQKDRLLLHDLSGGHMPHHRAAAHDDLGSIALLVKPDAISNPLLRLASQDDDDIGRFQLPSHDQELAQDGEERPVAEHCQEDESQNKPNQKL